MQTLSDLDEPVRIATFGAIGEAHLAAAVLADAGIDARVEGGTLAGMGWEFGTTIADIRLIVRRSDLEAAAGVLEAVREADPGEAESDPVPWDDFPGEDEAAEHEEAPGGDPAAEETVRRAWRSAVYGFLFLPGILHVYSLALLIGTGPFDITPATRRRFYGAAVLDAVGVLVAVLLGWHLFG